LKSTHGLIVFLILITFIFIKCKDTLVYPDEENRAGYVITFDDTYITEWNALRPLLKKYDTKVTFFISHYYTISDKNKELIDSLKLDGHEIACHSVNHKDAVKYLQTHTIDDYLNIDINPAINLMVGDGNVPHSFSYPYGMNNTVTDSALLEKFDLLRDVAEVQRHTANVTMIDTIESIYYKYDKSKVIAGLGIDNNFNISLEEIKRGFLRAKSNNEVIVFYSHRPVEKIGGSYQITHEYLEEVFKLAKSFGLKSFTFNELAH
jgi:peptidoglycan/xylan/chitin deacetylase (PgdA/CDA1 family)